MPPPKHRTDPRLERSPVRLARKLRGLSVQEAAAESGVSVATIYRTEKGDVDPTDEQPARYLEWLSLTGLRHGPKGWMDAPKQHAQVRALMAAGHESRPESYYEAMIALARERGEPKSVLRHLANAARRSSGRGWVDVVVPAIPRRPAFVSR